VDVLFGSVSIGRVRVTASFSLGPRHQRSGRDDDDDDDDDDDGSGDGEEKAAGGLWGAPRNDDEGSGGGGGGGGASGSGAGTEAVVRSFLAAAGLRGASGVAVRSLAALGDAFAFVDRVPVVLAPLVVEPRSTGGVAGHEASAAAPSSAAAAHSPAQGFSAPLSSSSSSAPSTSSLPPSSPRAGAAPVAVDFDAAFGGLLGGEALAARGARHYGLEALRAALGLALSSLLLGHPLAPCPDPAAGLRRLCSSLLAPGQLNASVLVLDPRRLAAALARACGAVASALLHGASFGLGQALSLAEAAVLGLGDALVATHLSPALAPATGQPRPSGGGSGGGSSGGSSGGGGVSRGIRPHNFAHGLALGVLGLVTEPLFHLRGGGGGGGNGASPGPSHAAQQHAVTAAWPARLGRGLACGAAGLGLKPLFGLLAEAKGAARSLGDFGDAASPAHARRAFLARLAAAGDPTGSRAALEASQRRSRPPRPFGPAGRLEPLATPPEHRGELAAAPQPLRLLPPAPSRGEQQRQQQRRQRRQLPGPPREPAPRWPEASSPAAETDPLQRGDDDLEK